MKKEVKKLSKKEQKAVSGGYGPVCPGGFYINCPALGWRRVCINNCPE